MGEGQKKKDVPLCPKCKNSVMDRVARDGLLESRVYSKAGLYPWECPLCRNRTLVKNRGLRIRKNGKEASTGQTATS
jgi:hypothetical protein